MIPEAVVEPGGQLRRVGAEEGKRLLLDLLFRQFPSMRQEAREAAPKKIAHPSELLLLRRSYGGPWSDPNRLGIERVRWEDVKQQYGGLLVLDEDATARVSVLCTSEPLADWWLALMDFPSEKERPDSPNIKELRPDNAYLKRYLNSRLTDNRRSLLTVRKGSGGAGGAPPCCRRYT